MNPSIREVASAAVGRWPFVLAALNIRVPSSPGKHGPCPACGGKDRFRFDDLQGRGTWFCNQLQEESCEGLILVSNVLHCSLGNAARQTTDLTRVCDVMSH